jgi:hypothetical protein
MAKLGPYFGTHTGNLIIHAGPFQVGSGHFTTFSDFEAGFAGTYSFLGQNGTLMLNIKLTDNNPASTTGPCSVTLNAATDNAGIYSADGQKLTLTTTLNNTPVQIYASGGGTQIDNISGHNVWIAP